MLLWQPEGFYKECRKSWYRHNLVQKENSETRLRAVAFRFLIFSFPLLPLLLLWTQALLRAQLCHLRRSSAAAFSCRRSSRGSAPSPISGWAANAACSSRSSFAGPPYPKQVRAFAWATPAAALSAVVCERRVVRTGGGDAVAPSSSTAATEVDFCSVCVCLSLCFKGLFGSPVFLIWLQMLWVVRQIFEVRVLKDGWVVGDETWTLMLILDWEEKMQEA